MAAADHVTEGQLDSLVTSIIARVAPGVVHLEFGSVASTARTAGAGIQYWTGDNGVTPTNALEADLIYNRPAV